ncbi:MAG: hypothetical protein Q8P02_05635 [Candidatus Micrarchaeota archaeon]|nr:hypothetical protein [Candidatus Micrarchaeota archaeon]
MSPLKRELTPKELERCSAKASQAFLALEPDFRENGCLIRKRPRSIRQGGRRIVVPIGRVSIRGEKIPFVMKLYILKGHGHAATHHLIKTGTDGIPHARRGELVQGDLNQLILGNHPDTGTYLQHALKIIQEHMRKIGV